VDQQELRRRSDQVFELATRQLRHLVMHYPDTFPSFTTQGKWTHQRSQFYRQYALKIIDSLTTPYFLAADRPGWEGILLHGIYHLPQNTGVDESMIWGDYFLLECLNAILQDDTSLPKPLKTH
jgi:hypothetical protein